MWQACSQIGIAASFNKAFFTLVEAERKSCDPSQATIYNPVSRKKRKEIKTKGLEKWLSRCTEAKPHDLSLNLGTYMVEREC